MSVTEKDVWNSLFRGKTESSGTLYDDKEQKNWAESKKKGTLNGRILIDIINIIFSDHPMYLLEVKISDLVTS